MLRRAFIISSLLTLIAGAAFAIPTPQALTGELTGELIMPPSLDAFADTIKYDNNVPTWWYGGLTNFIEATKFTPLANFELQRILVALYATSTTPLNIYVKQDSSGFPGGAPIWSGTLVYSLSNTWMGVTIDTMGLPQYTFPGGSNFWIQVNSAGPPYESYDAAPVQPPRSKTFYALYGGWFDSPGDNFIRALGEYQGGIVDVGCDSIWHGQNFHLPNPGALNVGCKVRNFGTGSATFQVACSLFTEGVGIYTFYSVLAPQTTTLGAGGTANLSFPAANINVSNRYRIRARTLLSGDIFPDNDTKDTETQIYTSPAELRYDDGFYSSAAYTSIAGDGWGLKVNPHQTGNYSITQVKVMAEYTAGDLAARVQVLNDNGASGAPGTVLWETVQVMAAGWNTFNINLLNQTGSFYIVYIFEHADSTSALRMDSYPASGMGWQKNSNVWTADPSADDWMLRATVAAGSGPNISITMIPESPPIIIPAQGGNFNWIGTVANGESSAQTFQVWVMVTLPNGQPYGPVLGPLSLTLGAGASLNRLRTQTVPGSAPSGTYTYTGNVGTYPGTTYDSDSFPFTKSATDAGGAWMGQWLNTGESFDEFVAAEPEGFRLFGNHPNPFNPTTLIEFALADAGWVTLAVFDVTGHQVATLVDGLREAGAHQVAFDGSRLASGVYLCRLSTSDYVAVNKMLLMK